MTHRSALSTVSACLLAIVMTVMVPLDGASAQGKPKGKKDEPVPVQLQAQCTWTGQRVLHSLLREDTVAAKDHLGFYEKFGCPSDYLTKAFACAVDAPTGASRPKADALVINCWETLSPTRSSEDDADATKRPERKQAK
jgi:hypothetical protein